jgi:SNF family Na+-dependent transporter
VSFQHVVNVKVFSEAFTSSAFSLSLIYGTCFTFTAHLSLD